MAKKTKSKDARVLKAGKTARFKCEECSTEFEVTLEPKAANRGDEYDCMIDPKRVECCPFCESAQIVLY